MADYHASTKPLSRSGGRSAVAAMSYRTGTELVDRRTGVVHDYRRRGGVEYAAREVVVPDGCSSLTREQLWNAAELAEQRKDARTAREWEMALPCELKKEQRIELVERFAQELARRYGTAVDYALHEPSKRGDQRNYHAHVMQTTRQLRDGQLQEKSLLELNDKKLAAQGHDTGRKQIEQIRATWAELCNQALERAGSEERVDHRSLKRQHTALVREIEQLRAEDKEQEAQLAELKAMELERTPQVHVGWRATAMHREAMAVERAEMREAAQKEREKRRSLIAQLREKLEELWKEIAARLQVKEATEPKQKAEEITAAVVAPDRDLPETTVPESVEVREPAVQAEAKHEARPTPVAEDPERQATADVPAAVNPERAIAPEQTAPPAPKPELTSKQKQLLAMAKVAESRSRFEMTREQAHLFADGLHSPGKYRYGNGRGRESIEDLLRGATVIDIKGLCNVSTQRRGEQVVFRVDVQPGRGAELAGLLRDAAQKQPAHDAARERQLQRGGKSLDRGRGGRG